MRWNSLTLESNLKYFFKSTSWIRLYLLIPKSCLPLVWAHEMPHVQRLKKIITNAFCLFHAFISVDGMIKQKEEPLEMKHQILQMLQIHQMLDVFVHQGCIILTHL